MALPVGVATVDVTFGVPVTFRGSNLATSVTVTPSADLVHTASGTPLVAMLEDLSVGEGVQGVLTLPVTDQDGFQDLAGNAYKNWYYTITLQYSMKGKTLPPKTKVFQLPAGQGPTVDLDLIPSGNAQLAYIAPSLPVTSVVGKTGAVLGSDIAADPALAGTFETQTHAAATYAQSENVASRVLKLDTRNLLIPGAPFERIGSANPPTINVHSAPNTLNPNQSFTAAALLTNGMATFCRAGNFITVGSGKSPTYRTPRASAGREPFSLMHGFDGTRIAYMLTSAPGAAWRLMVDGQYVSDVNSTAGVGGGATSIIDVTFPDARPRRIRLDLTGNDLQTVIIGPTDTIWALQPRGPRCIIIGDSYTGGSGAAPTGFNGLSSWAWTFADTIGWDDVWQSGIGGTGWINRNSGQTNNYEDRVASDIVAFAPDVVILYGSRNDYNNGATAIGAAAGRTVTAIRAGLPNALIIVLGPDGSAHPVDGTADTTWKPIQDAIFSAVSSTNGVITLDTCVPGIFTGTGKAGATTGSGNGDVYLQSDGVHPNQAGADYLGRRIAQKLLSALSNS